MKDDLLIELNRYSQNLGLLFHHPKMLKRIFRVYLDKIFSGKNAIRQVEIAVCYECNAKCEQCSCARSLNKKRKRLTKEQFKKLVDESIKMGAFQFNITGGEPLIYLQDTLDLVKYISGKECYVHLCTNAILLDGKTLVKLKKNGLDSLEFGFDSADPNIHNTNRNKKAYERVLSATKMAKELGFDVIWDTIITPKKIENGDLLSIIKLAKSYGAKVQITPPCVMGKWAENEGILLSEENKKYFKKMLRIPRVRTDTFSSLLTPGCPAAREKLAVNPYGDVLPCSLVQISYGNFLNEPLAEIQRKMLKEPYYKGGKGILSCLPSFDKRFIDMFLDKEND